METTRFGSTGLAVSRLALGTATFGGQCDEATAVAILDHALELGITLVDTADKYPLGSSHEQAGTTEAIVGRWLRHHLDEIVVATKVHGPTGPHPWDRGLGRRHVTTAVDASLRRLGVEAIDLYQLHRPDPATPIDETLETLTDLVRWGKVRHVGCSNFLAYQVARALGRSETRGFAAFASVQARHNLLFRAHERELFPLCREEGLAVLSYNVLAGGLLSGKHDLDAGPAPGSRFVATGAASLYRERYWDDTRLATVRAVAEVADELGLSLPALATAWALGHPARPILVLGATRPEHLDEPVRALDVVLPEAARTRLDELTATFRRDDAVQ